MVHAIKCGNGISRILKNNDLSMPLEKPSHIWMGEWDVKRGERGLDETPSISAKDIVGLTLFVLGISLPLLLKWLREAISDIYLACLGLSLSTLGIALLNVKTRNYEKHSRSMLSLLFFILLDFFLIYIVILTILCPAPSRMEVSARILDGLKDSAARDSNWQSLREIFEEISSKSSFQKPQIWWIYKILSHGDRSCEVMLISLRRSIEMNAIEEAGIIINALHQMFEKIDLIVSEFATYYVFLATLVLFFSTIIFLGGNAPQIGIPQARASSGLLTYSYPILLSLGLACSFYTNDLYPLFGWVLYVVFMLIVFRTIGYDRATLFGFAILTGGLLGAYTPIHPFSCLWYFITFCFFMLILIPSVLLGISRDVLLAASILAGCAGVNSAISMTFIHTPISPLIALFSVVYDLISIIFALSEVSALPGVLGASIRSVEREGFWPVLGFIISVLLLAFTLLAYFNPIPSLLWILSLSLLCYVLIYSMRVYTLRRKRLAKFGELGSARALFLVSIPELIFISIFPMLYHEDNPLYLLLVNILFSACALVFIAWYIRGDRSLRDFLLEHRPIRFSLFSLTMTLGPIICLLDLGPTSYHLSLILPMLGLLSIHRRSLRRKHLG